MIDVGRRTGSPRSSRACAQPLGQCRAAGRPLRLFVALAALLAALAVVVGSRVTLAKADDTSTCTVSTILVNSCRPWMGGTAANYPQAKSDTTSQLLFSEQRLGRQMDIQHTYHSVGDNTLSATDRYFATRANTMLFTNWKPTASWGNLTGQNAAIDSMAASIKSISPNRIFLTLNHEPENDVSPGGDPNCPSVTYKGTSGSVADYRAMWRHVRERFAADGVNNVVWVMDYMNWPPWDCLIPDLWPGNDLVDWVTFNGYQLSGNGTFTSAVGHIYNLLQSRTDATHAFTSKPWGCWNGACMDLLRRRRSPTSTPPKRHSTPTLSLG